VRCPYCGAKETRVFDSRPADEGEGIRRRRECETCHRRFTTFERVERLALYVIKRNGARERFDRGKILRGLRLACEGRPVDDAALQQVAEDIERTALEAGTGTIKSREIGDAVIEALRNVDDVAYVRFASVYRRLADVDRLMDEIQALKARKQLDAELASQVLLIPLTPQRPERN
jgi:transcriptional repressor NrdR